LAGFFVPAESPPRAGFLRFWRSKMFAATLEAMFEKALEAGPWAGVLLIAIVLAGLVWRMSVSQQEIIRHLLGMPNATKKRRK